MFELSIKIGVTPELNALLTRFLDVQQLGALTNQLETIKEATAAAAQPVKVAAITENAPEKPTEAPQQHETAKAEQVQAEAENAPESEKTSYTDADLREEMHKVRLRIEGEDYKTNKTAPKVVAYHAKVTAQFRNIAMTLGANKPTELPDSKRAAFVEAIQALHIEDDAVQEELPF